MSTVGITQLRNLDRLPIEAKEALFLFFDKLTDDEAMMDNIVGCYMVGSVASGDFHKGDSNIDFVMVTHMPWTGEALAVIKHLHKSVDKHVVTPFCGYHITAEQLQQAGGSEPITVCTVKDGVYKINSHLEMDKVALYELQQNGLCIYGKPTDSLNINVHIKDVITQLHDYVNGYWNKWLRAHKLPMPKGWSLLLNPKVSQQGVLGMARPLYTLRSGSIGSKHLAGIYLSRYFKGEYADIIKHAAQLRQQNTASKGFSPSRYKQTQAVMRRTLEAFNNDYEKVMAQF